ncbi:ribonuclease H-like domain-containing protein [Tanacetum coccineum]
MTGSGASPTPTPLSKKLALFFFEELCASYEVDKYLCSPINETSACSLAPLTPKETKVDKIVLSWTLFTLSDSLCARIIVAHPKSAKEAWSFISDIVKDNKRSRTNTLKAELRSIKLGDQSMESYFQKINSIVNIHTSLDARVNEEDIVRYALEGLPDTYNQVCGYMHWKYNFLDLKAVRSLLIAEEMRLKSKVLALPMDSSSPMAFVASLSNNSRPSSSGFNKGRGTSENSTNDLLNKLLAQLGKLGMNISYTSTNTVAHTDFMTRRVLFRRDSTGDLYPVTAPSPILHAFLVSQHMWHQRPGHPGSDVLRRLVSNNVISCNKEKPPVLCHACQLGKHVRLLFVSSNTIVSSCFDIVHSDV